MIRRQVMVALDGSDKDRRALAVGVAFAKLAEARLHLVRVVAPPPTDVTGLPVAPGLGDAAEKEYAEARRSLTTLEAASTAGPDAVTTALLKSRDIPGALIQHADERDALFVVMATRAPGVASRALVGSVADQVMRESARPVILAPPGAGFLAGKEPSIARLLVPLENSSLSFRSLEFVIELPHGRALEYVLIEVVAAENDRAGAQMRLEKSAEWLRSRGARAVEVVVAQGTEVAATILTVVREALPDAIAMSTRGAGGLGRLTFGSVAEGVVRGSELPVMLLTPRALVAE